MRYDLGLPGTAAMAGPDKRMEGVGLLEPASPQPWQGNPNLASLTSINILLLDNEALVREGVRMVLEREADLQIGHEAGTLDEALQPAIDPDVIVVEPLLTGDRSRGAELVTDLLQRYPNSQVLVLSQMESVEDVQLFLSRGVRGYVLKKAPAIELVEAVRRVAAGDEYLQPSLGAALLKANRKRSSRNGVAELTPREKEVLRVLAIGHTNAEAAAILSYAVRTVEGYRSRIMRKLDVESRAELVRAASELDLLHFERQ
jgi:two-component system, NarL family, response regulator NreC